jgi:hypothetical protein
MWVNEEFRASQEETAHASSRLLFEAFDAMRGERSAPRREDLDLRQLRRLLPYLFIAEQDASSRDFRWRLAGSAVGALMGGEVTGLSFTLGWNEFEANVIRRFLSSVSAAHKPGLLRMRFMTDSGQSIVAEMAAVPLMAADGNATQVLGGFFAFADPALKHFNALTGRELVTARQASGEAIATVLQEPPQQHRFRVITGGREG